MGSLATMRPSFRTSLLVFGIFGTIFGGIAVGLAVFVWQCMFPILQISALQAGRIISAAPQFNRSRSLVAVSDTTRGAASLKGCCYAATLIFTAIGSSSHVAAYGEFHYWGGASHLQEFSCGQPPNVETVWDRERRAEAIAVLTFMVVLAIHVAPRKLESLIGWVDGSRRNDPNH